ncbi:hypothetical protein CGJ15_27220, partial [Vibrio parahaemolyticus]
NNSRNVMKFTENIKERLFYKLMICFLRYHNLFLIYVRAKVRYLAESQNHTKFIFFKNEERINYRTANH